MTETDFGEMGMAFLVSLLGLILVPARGQLVGPGGMTTYGGGGRRHGGYARVSEPGKGFFVAGSSLTGVNGVYQRVETISPKMSGLHE